MATFVAEAEGSSCPNLRDFVRNGPTESLKLRLNDLKINLHYCYFKNRYMVTSYYCPEPAPPSVFPFFLSYSPFLPPLKQVSM